MFLNGFMLEHTRKDCVSISLPNQVKERNRECLGKLLCRRWKRLSTFVRKLISSVSVAIIVTSLYYLLFSARHIQDVAAEETQAEKSEDSNSNSERNLLEFDDNIEAKNIKNRALGPTNIRQRAVVDAFIHAWNGYKKFAWGHDHLKPLTGDYEDWYGLGLTIVDSLDTILLMGLTEEFELSRSWIEKDLNFNTPHDVNVFEVTIRVLGGLLSTYHLSGDKIFLERALDLGSRLLSCFRTTYGIPESDVNLLTRKAHSPTWGPDSTTSEVASIQLEFRDLSRSCGDPTFEEAVKRISSHIHYLPKVDGLAPIFISPESGRFRTHSTITLGARGDSYYEYLLKQWIQTGKTINYLREDYVDAIWGIEKHLIRATTHEKYLFIGELVAGKHFRPKMDHLTCFLPGTLALGVIHGLPEEHLKLAEELIWTCYQTYAQQPTFLAPEVSHFNYQGGTDPDIYVKSHDAHNLLRPEFVESLWYMYQVTGNKTYQNWGWEVFQAFEKYSKTNYGYTTLGDVTNPFNTRPKDKMESFFLSETLKYLYLLFADDRFVLDLKKYVLNTEAHPLPIYNQ